MNVAIVYESMFGSTRWIAESIAAGFGPRADVTVLNVRNASDRRVASADLLVVGGPTHVRGMSRPSTRKGTPGAVAKAGGTLVLEPGAERGPGVREWLALLGHQSGLAAAFDTRLQGPALLTGRASKAIASRLADRGRTLVTTPESFLVSRGNQLLEGEADRARAWGSHLATVAAAARARASKTDAPLAGDQS